ncbi:short-chain dehydrogenase [Devosia epidermidihirudinis]|uniref:Short-chain dehydrogenase n=1 Tax=Devosia epidermidihirudinis TaxID=1293439 RepID=A0A0F5Q344_9HYPH|nr:glucose 1-dehydrogenase [Devosia epidermidihirudinis]KKC35300.1 short-chain dehydrogenase [Devosia epidermidihirudinis]
MQKLTGKVAIVTGASSGMGLGIAQRLVADGASVVLAAIDQAGLEAAAAALATPHRVRICVADVSKNADMARLTADAVAAFGGVDILVNSAGLQRYGTVVDTTEETWDEVFNVNIKGIFLASKHAIPEMEERGGGSVINIASVQAYASQANVAAYTATKGAILALTRAMALDHAPARIRVNAICPASIDTPMLRWAADLWKGDSTAEATMAGWGKAHPLGRVGTVEEIGALASFLASDECGFMTGADIKVDGGALSKLAIILPE